MNDFTDVPRKYYVMYPGDNSNSPFEFEVYDTWAQAQSCVRNNPGYGLYIFGSEYHKP